MPRRRFTVESPATTLVSGTVATSTFWLVNAVPAVPVYLTDPTAREMPTLPVAPAAFAISVYGVEPPREYDAVSPVMFRSPSKRVNPARVPAATAVKPLNATVRSASFAPCRTWPS